MHSEHPEPVCHQHRQVSRREGHLSFRARLSDTPCVRPRGCVHTFAMCVHTRVHVSPAGMYRPPKRGLPREGGAPKGIRAGRVGPGRVGPQGHPGCGWCGGQGTWSVETQSRRFLRTRLWEDVGVLRTPSLPRNQDHDTRLRGAAAPGCAYLAELHPWSLSLICTHRPRGLPEALLLLSSRKME